jgi:ATP-binding protein involved in chromosome partitioning
MTDILPSLDQLPEAARIRSRRLSDGVATVIADANGLDAAGQRALQAAIKAAAMQSPDVREVRVAMTASQRGRTIIVVGSGKGGVGKSTLTTNLAVALARAGRKVGLIDADIYGPSQPTLLGSDEKPTAENDKLIPVEAHGLKFLSLGQLVGAGQALAWRGPMATGALTRLLEAEWGDCELILVDLPPGTGDVQLTLLQKARPAGAVVISTPQDLSLIDARRAIDLFGKLDVPVLGLVENMAGYICPHCGEGSDPFGSGGAEAAAAELGVRFLGRLPLSQAIRSASDAGNPPAAGDGPEAQAFADLAAAVMRSLDTAAA